MTSLPSLLDMVDPLSAPEPAPPELLDRLLAAAADHRKGRRRTGLLAIAASVLVAVALGTWGVTAIRRDTTPPVFAGPVVIDKQASDPLSGVSAHVWIHPGAWGSKVVVTIDGVKPGTTCTLTVIGLDGHREIAATWKADYAGSASVDGTVSGTPSSLAELEVADATGHVLVPVPLQ